ncbi:quinolinate synthase NadA [Granulicella tundricola]|uniref:Quinolinate synthase n=1 Tax=Granulicella tundricola (strain ATCC BAA-1859 / DSM 23138 / MP5ACTX9) TaxID=1198114 RepID=E8X127_GRATM|nr:quinolinate synthase NadA [Granulicella tundricola]ADW67893.1 quinolinate synthetase complex, A subunit [Granulicella tundricola MP5ACTX9]
MSVVLIEESPAEAIRQACPLDHYLSQPDHTMDARIAAARAKLGKQALILGHHYQRDEVIRFADFTGDSYKLSKVAAETDAKYILFCGVHFMAESADVLAQPWQTVILPDLNAGCSMADMAEIGQVENCWDSLERLGVGEGLIPLTYMNSAADIKAFCGERNGLVCTSSNAPGAFDWAFARGQRILFLPDQHLGRNTAFAMGIPMDQMVVWDPYMINGGVDPARLKAAKVILWKGHCSVHQRFLPQHVDRIRAEEPGMKVIVHPECRWEVCQKADALGSTEKIIEYIEKSPEGSSFAVGTEIHLVNRLAARFAPLGKRVITLDDSGCLCTTMYRISPAHLAWTLENLVEGNVVNRIKVSDDTKHWAKVALDRMLEVRTETAASAPMKA